MRYLFLILLLLPFVEIYTLIVIGSSLGAINTVLLTILSGVIGLYLLRNQGIRTLINIRSNQEYDFTPDTILKTLFTPIGGFFLLIPGFITDFLGILILFPLTRLLILGLLFSRFRPLQPNKPKENSTEDWIEGEYKKDKWIFWLEKYVRIPTYSTREVNAIVNSALT